ncbi:hypothetical protein Prum_012670 [Phytohabitans rumicis]|uniref:Uncharacterized protein n=1 Tax=Phytohabitans rumicis TaxID=1076125 RepID=A0A6V8L4P5_9ACTN|nr:hypothetical protein Prum_012670 [Phytohabitans rumicis]
MLAERGRFGGGDHAGERPGVDTLGVGPLQRGRTGVGVAVVGGNGAMRGEVSPALFERRDVAVVVAGVDVSDHTEVLDRVAPARAGHLQVTIGAERRRHARRNGLVGGDGGVSVKAVGGIVGGRQERDAEALQQGPRAVPRLRQLGGDMVVELVGICGVGTVGDAEDVRELAGQPILHRGAPKHRPVGAEQSPRLPGAILRQRSFADAEPVQRHTARVQQPRHVVIRLDEQRGRVGERDVIAQDPGVDVPVRGDDR